MKKFIIITINFLIICALQAQIPQNPTSALSPNAANLGLYGDIPVSLYTGTPEISIPLYELQIYDFTLPISLNYHAAGVQVDQRPSWVGMGWSLFAGGVITRKQNGNYIDEYNNTKFYDYGTKVGYYFNHNALNITNWNNRNYLRSKAQENIQKDYAPDEFTFNFAGYVGKFYLDHNGNWVVQSNKPLKVEFNGQFPNVPLQVNSKGSSPYFGGFTITTENGIKYVFGNTPNAVDFSIDFFGQSEFFHSRGHSNKGWIATAWYLTRITLPNNETINFNYERKEYDNQMYISVYNDLGAKSESSSGIFNPQSNCQSMSISPISESYTGNLISSVYLKEIYTANVKIQFHKSLSRELRYSQSIYNSKYSKWISSGQTMQYDFLPFLKSREDNYPACLNNLKCYKLDKITIENKSNNEVIKSISLHYSDSIPVSLGKRLVLLRVKESGKTPYSFQYYKINDLPDYLANKSDHWGYYNNTYADVYNSNYYNLRNPSAEYTKYGVLTKITYPTGGYTDFEFEPHYYRKQLNENRWVSPLITFSANKLAGGVRIKKIKHYSTSSTIPDIVKEYYYVSDYLQNKTNAQQSSGIMGGQIQYSFKYIVYAFSENNVRKELSIFSSHSALPSCNNSSSHIGYSEVIEKNADNSFTRHLFTNFDNGFMDEAADAVIQHSRTPYEPYASKSMDRGRLLAVEDYNTNGIKVKSKTLSYEKDTNTFVRAMTGIRKNVCLGSAVSYDEGSAYKIYTYSWLINKKTETYYNSLNGSETQKSVEEYTYDNNNLLKTITNTNSNGQKFTTLNKYPTDFSANIYNAPYPTMVSKNILSPVVQKITYLEGSNRIVSGENINFREYTTSSGKIYKPQSISYLLNDNSATTTNYSQFWKQKMTFTYNDFGKILTTLDNESNFSTVYLWGYNNQYPIIKIENATLNQVKDLVDESYWKEANKTFNISDYAIYKYNERIYARLELLKDMYIYQLKIDEAPKNTPVNIAVKFEGLQEIKSAEEFSKYAENLVYLPIANLASTNEEKPDDNSMSIYLSFNGLNWLNDRIVIGSIACFDIKLFGGVLFDGATIEDNNIATLGETLRAALPEAWVWTYTHKPFVGLTSIIDPHGVKTTFEYDNFGRLKNTKDNDLKLLQEYDYHYFNQ